MVMGMNFRNGLNRLLPFLALLAPSAAHAEAISVSAWYAASEREVALLRSIAVERFDGEDGAALALLIERRLGEAKDRDGGPYFDVRRGDTDGVVSGAVTTGVDVSRFRKTISECPDGPKAKCKREERVDVDISCRKRVISLDADLRVERDRDGRLIYSTSNPKREEASWCPDDSSPPEAEGVVRQMLEAVATEFVDAVVPYHRKQNIRFREDRGGLTKSDGERFKLALRQTKSDAGAACGTWGEIEASAPGQSSVLFNLALCAEAAGDLDRAEQIYRTVADRSTTRSGDIGDALRRIQRRRDAVADERARAAGRG